MPTPKKPPATPSHPTIKRLFALSGNRCAFPKCPTHLVDPLSGSIVGEVCHIKGSKSGAPRYDAHQSAQHRHSFDNLLLLCNVHHKIVDDDESAYTVKRLRKMKSDHEEANRHTRRDQAARAEQFASAVVYNDNRIRVASERQSGGQTAHTIYNYHGDPQAHDSMRVEGAVAVGVEEGLVKAFGCVGVKLTLACRSRRPARIKSASLLIHGDDFLRPFQEAFQSSFGHTPLEGSTQTLEVRLFPLLRPDTPEGFVFEQDDVRRFFYPIPIPTTPLAMKARPEDVSFAVRWFDDSQTNVVDGERVQNAIQSIADVYKGKYGICRPTFDIQVHAKSRTPPTLDCVGKTNPKPATFVPPKAHGTSRSKAKPVQRKKRTTRRKGQS